MGRFSQYIVHKFGGSNLVDANGFKEVVARLKGMDEVIIVSAVFGVTTSLQNLLDVAQYRGNFQIVLSEITDQHFKIIDALFLRGKTKTHLLIEQVRADLVNIKDLLHATSLVEEYSEKVRAMVIGYGEKWSAKILTNLLNEEDKKRKAFYLDAIHMLRTHEKNDILCVDWESSKTKLINFLHNRSAGQLAITGFLACDEENRMITLGRNGSDYSAAIFAKLICSKKLFIWKDDEGVFSADPTRVKSAFPISHLSYESSLELAYFGASVIHPKTIAPAMELKISAYIKNVFNLNTVGTVISSKPSVSSLPVQGITSIDDIVLITIEGTGLIGLSSTVVRVFQVLQDLNVSVILISQASSEHSICFAVELSFSNTVVNALKNVFEFELKQGLIENIHLDKDSAILSVVGDGMVGTIGVASNLTTTLMNVNVNIKAIAQGSSERNISIVVARQDIHKALRAVHSGFYLSDKTLSIGIIGPGLIGSTLMSQIGEALQRLREQYHVQLLVRGICNSQKMLLSHKEIELKKWKRDFAKSQIKSDLEIFCRHIVADDVPHALIIDCTASSKVAREYKNFIRKGAHVITPNKHSGADDFFNYQNLKSLLREKKRHYLYETTVCAGLPVITTLHDIIQTGDEVLEIQGVVSGTLSYVFNQLAKGFLFSQVIKDAQRLGYTEPDPREDLSGMDVARKFVILARELGFSTELKEIEIDSLVPDALNEGGPDFFLQELSKFDQEIQKEVEKKVKKNEKGMYVGSIQSGGVVEVGIKSFPESHPFYRLTGTDNMLIFRTRRYNELPLVIQGPGAGAEVTAAGVFADLLRLVSFLGK